MCLFGGGHGPSQETDIRVLDLQTMQWSSLYPTTPRKEMTIANGDSDLGRWISTNQPYARHTYNNMLVAGRRFYLFTPYGQADHLDGPNVPYGGRVCWYDFDTGAWSYSRYSNEQTPWAYLCGRGAGSGIRLGRDRGPVRQQSRVMKCGSTIRGQYVHNGTGFSE